MVDTYGGLAPHGGGALSGKDGTKVDRSGAYMARCIAKNIVAAGLAEKCTVALAYAIGRADPVAVDVDTHLTGTYSDKLLEQAVRCFFDLTPAGMIHTLQLNQPILRTPATMATLPGQTCRGSRPVRPESLRSCVRSWITEMVAAEIYSILFFW